MSDRLVTVEPNEHEIPLKPPSQALVKIPAALAPLIVFEGNDGVGKTTQMQMTADKLAERGFPVQMVKFNASPLTVEGIRLGKSENYNVYANTFLHACSLADQVERLALPALTEGKIVLCDRYAYSLIARGIVRGALTEVLIPMLSFLSQPDLVLYYRLPPEKALVRRNQKGARAITYWESGADVTDLQDNLQESFLQFQGRVFDTFAHYSEAFAFQTIDSDCGFEDLFARTWCNVEKKLELVGVTRSLQRLAIKEGP